MQKGSILAFWSLRCLAYARSNSPGTPDYYISLITWITLAIKSLNLPKKLTTEILANQDALQQFRDWLGKQDYPAIFILADANITNHCFPLIEEQLQDFPIQGILEIPPGEQNKTINCCEDIWEQLIDNGAGRQSLLINLGGGLITDLGGFIASSFQRGIDYVNLPTTLLAMTDAAIGGKTGVNFRGIKNQIGTFCQPAKTVIYPPFLDTLENRQFRAGFAEMIKHGLIASPNLWYALKQCQPTDKKAVKQHLEASAKVKQVIVEADFREAGTRKKLNFGHTIGHALESYSQLYDENPLYHGEAVALGMRVEAWLSHHYHKLDVLDYEDIKEFLARAFPVYNLPENAFEDLSAYLIYDKKNTVEGINFTLLDHAGHATADHYLSPDVIEEAVNQVLISNPE